MAELRLRTAGNIGIQPSYIKGMENSGLCYFIWDDDCDVVGGQCSHCNTIIWTSPRSNPILSERKPSNVPDSGKGYRKYYEDNLQRFLDSLPNCPECGKTDHDLFINNTSFPRLKDGTSPDYSQINIELENRDPNSVKVWWLEAD
ncbi:hypothetical protein [Microbulbifer halophilus]|uniref:Uncharacterized protein n=1 Tax=Microbulbifer halophilus TaxID=453963 RepID=A0ABW5EKF5_9GAMM|nr:hypothetical protein [Microbulbifer halophilus]MCW8128707.1 hypothetical protein [Microbulbifer halophilus]